MPEQASSLWSDLDPNDAPTLHWLRRIDGPRVVLLLGAFDPPSNAHLALARAGARIERAPAAFCLTKVTLDRPPDELLPAHERLRLLYDIASDDRFGLAICNRGTYLDVARALARDGFEASFVIGSDKLPQLADASFYADGEAGVTQTFAELRFVVVRRAGAEVQRDDVLVVDTDQVFATSRESEISATEVRRRIRTGENVDGLVPPRVALALGGYTSPR
jgi:nicotinic acid mononucleotide adenylyltransferase